MKDAVIRGGTPDATLSNGRGTSSGRSPGSYPGRCGFKSRRAYHLPLTNGDSMIVEIRAAEGGDDAKGLVLDLFGIYVRRLQRRRL